MYRMNEVRAFSLVNNNINVHTIEDGNRAIVMGTWKVEVVAGLKWGSNHIF